MLDLQELADQLDHKAVKDDVVKLDQLVDQVTTDAQEHSVHLDHKDLWDHPEYPV